MPPASTLQAGSQRPCELAPCQESQWCGHLIDLFVQRGARELFVLATLFFGTKGGYYDTDDYDGNGTAH